MTRSQQPGPEWASLYSILENHHRIWLTTHQNPDGDGLGSELALWGVLRRMGKDVRIINADRLPDRYAFLGREAAFERYEPRTHDEYLRTVEVAVLLDAGRVSRMGSLERWFRSAEMKVCIDHHASSGSEAFDWYGVDASAAATGQLVYEGLQSVGHEGDRTIALGAYVALVTDTGSFRFSNSNSRAHALAAELLNWDINPAVVFDAVFGNWKLARLRLMGHAFADALVENKGRLIVLRIPHGLLLDLNASPEDAEGLVDLARNVRDSEVVVCLLEAEDGGVRVSLRSKGNCDVRPIAVALGGGGHPYASGARVSGALEDITQRVITLVGSALPPLKGTISNA